MKASELIHKLSLFPDDTEVRVYKEIGGVRRAIPVSESRVLKVNTIAREDAGLPEFIILDGDR
jgi:hypothetical protein